MFIIKICLLDIKGWLVIVLILNSTLWTRSFLLGAVMLWTGNIVVHWMIELSQYEKLLDEGRLLLQMMATVLKMLNEDLVSDVVCCIVSQMYR